MTGRVIHLLTETDSFSDKHGAALQRWVANVLKFEESETMVGCARADASWGLAHVKTIHLPGLWAYSHIKGRYHMPWSLRRPLLRKILGPALKGLKAGCVVWIHNRPDYAAAIEADVRAAGARLVVHLHNSLLVSFPTKVTASFKADRLIFCSAYLEEEARRSFPDLQKTTVIYNGADEKRFYPGHHPVGSDPSHAKTPVVLFAGRLVPEKGAHIFVEAMWLLQARGVRAKGRLLGATGFGSANRATAYSRKIMRNAPGNVQFGGYMAGSALAEEFRGASIFCSPSVWEEPFGLVNVEAMASGLPTITTRGGGVPEIFANGGAVLVARNSAVELASALERVIRDRELRKRLAAEAYQSFHQKFTWRTVHSRYREVLDGLA
jgi:spore coat protein SA